MSTHRSIPPETPRDRARFDSHCERLPNGCLVHDGFEYGKGYAGFLLEGNARAHRVSYVWAYGETDGDIHHLCGNKRCVEPTHLSDTSDGIAYPRHRGATPQTHCVHGHEFDGANTYIDPKTGWRQCRTCRRETVHRLADADRDAHNAKRRARRKRITYDIRPCQCCGLDYQPMRSDSRFCTRQACINERQRNRRQGR